MVQKIYCATSETYIMRRSLLRSVRPKLSSKVRGIISSGILYNVENESGDWEQYFGEWENQKKGGTDTNCCWAYSACECMETTLEFLWKSGQFSDEDKKWFQDNGYIDSDGDFYLSRRFIPMLSGVKDRGNDPAEFWRLTKKYGAIPDKVLPYTNMNDYYDKSKITHEMYSLGEDFLKRVNIAYQDIGSRFYKKNLDLIKVSLKQSSLQICIPVPNDGAWNQIKVDYPTDNISAQHAVELYKVDDTSSHPYFILDQYEPRKKQLSKDYFIPIVTQAVITPKKSVKTIPQTSLYALIMRAIAKYMGLNSVDTQIKTIV